MFVPSTCYEPGFPQVWEGLDYQSAVDATPRWYGVGVGNGNNGVSHLYPSFYCKTNDPWTLARATVLSDFEPAFQQAALNALNLEGEAEYTVSATIYNPEDVDPSEAPDTIYLHSYVCPECEHAWQCEGDESATQHCPDCGTLNVESDECEEQERDGDDSYCSANGAWMIVEVFPLGDDAEFTSAPEYDSLEDCFDANVLALARED